MRHIAIVGTGPAGFYMAEALLKALGEAVRIDLVDRLPTPYGLIRAGVAPDHQSIKAVSRRYEQVATDPRVRLVGGVTLGTDLTLAELRALYHDVVLATGAPADRRLGVAGDDLPGVVGSAAFVGWYNGHPDQAGLAPPLGGDTAVIVGNGNVAIDCARILAKTRDELATSDIVGPALDALAGSGIRHIRILGRRGPQQARFTLKEVGEMGELARATPVVDPAAFPPADTDAALETGQRRVVEVLRRFAAAGPDATKPVRIHFDFWRRPLGIVGDGRVEAIDVMETRLEGDRAVDTGRVERIAAGLVIPAIGYRSLAIDGAAFDAGAGRFASEEGRIDAGLWCVGWARRGPSGTIGTNRTDAIGVAGRLLAEPATGDREGGAGLDALLAGRGLRATSFTDWQRIDAAEVAAARPGAPREKLRAVDAMRALLGGGGQAGA